MRKRTRQTAALLLALVMVMGTFAGCKKKAEEDPDNGNKIDMTADYVYVPEYTSLPEEIQDISNPCIIGDKIYFSSYVQVWPDGSIVTQEERDQYYQDLNDFYTEQFSRLESGEISDEDFSRITPPMQGFSDEIRLYSVKTDGSDFTSLDAFTPVEIPVGRYSSSGVSRMGIGPSENLYVLEVTYESIFDTPEGFDETLGNIWDYHVEDKNNFYITTLDETGAKLQQIHLNSYIGNLPPNTYFYINYFAFDEAGNLYFDCGEQGFYVVDPNGELLFKLEMESWINGCINLADGGVGVVVYDEENMGYVAKPIDLAAKGWGEAVPLPLNAYEFMPGGKDFDFCYNTGISLFGYDIETGIETKVITWLNNSIDGNSIRYCKVEENGDLFVISSNYESERVKHEVARLVKTPASEVTQKEPIVLACNYFDYQLRGAVLEFNRTNPNYRIEIHDYSEYNTGYDYMAGVTKLNTEIISGNVPDIIITSELPVKQYAAKGLLEDLYTFIDNDASLSRDDLVLSVFEAMESSGELYMITPSFNLITIAGMASVLGTEPGWTMTELMALIEAHPEADYPLGQYITRESIFNELLNYSMDSYVDWATGECSFDTEDFKSLLEFAMLFPEQTYYETYGVASSSSIAVMDTAMPMPIEEEYLDENTLLAEGRMLAKLFYMYDFYEYQYRNAALGGDIVFKGIPTEDGGGSVAQLGTSIAMTTSCKNKEGAWEFMRTLLTEEFQLNNWGIPTNRNVLDEKLEAMMKQEYDDEGKPIPYGSVGVMNGEEIYYYALSEQEKDQILQIIDNVKYTASYDNSLLDIVREEAGAFFAGEKSVNDAAAYIQSRMMLYVNEQR